MCDTCGCSDDNDIRMTNMQDGETVAVHRPEEDDGHEHGHSHGHHRETKTIRLEQQVLTKNDLLAERNRGWFIGRSILALNLVSSPGAGKTTLLERTIRDLAGRAAISVIEGDQESTNDAERIRSTGCPVVQINTGAACHLDAHMISHALGELQPSVHSIVMIENVGNLVCPSMFDLGEKSKVLIVSVTEGEDKPLKYPHMFQASELVILNKTDLLPYLDFDVDKFAACTHQVNPDAQILQVSATKGNGMEAWYEWVIQGTTGKFSRSVSM